MAAWNEADHPRDEEGKFTDKGGGTSTAQSYEDKMQRRADLLFPKTIDKNNVENLKENDILKKYKNSRLEKLNQSINNKSIETAPRWSNNTKFSDAELQKARIFIQGEEKFSPNAYYPVNGDKLTIGYGHTKLVDGKPITLGMKITKEKAEELYRKDFEEHTTGLKEVEVPLTSNQKIALASFMFNLGPNILHNSDLLKKLNSGDYEGAANKFGEYIHQKGKVLKGLVNRRRREKELFLTPDGE